MDWWVEIKAVWERYRWWLCGGLATILLAAVAGGWLFMHVPDSKGTTAQTMPQFSATSAASMSSRTTSAMATNVKHDTKIMVEVKGAVNHAGVYQFAGDARVLAAVKRAGGLRADADGQQLNQAKKLTDQMVVYVPMVGEKVPDSMTTAGQTETSTVAGSESGGADAGATVNLNTATKEQLTKLTGVGDKKAQKIIDYRTSHGGFKQVDELKQVPGFGDKTVQQLVPHLSLS
ncbi:helix-hairpin-helix domain-containing protein [Furfurilactobacillus siliginis]|uniref:Competence protein CelA n=1 Tax=Furfurilactobacillus siliginis TaxID=348151 RepID=A0A0R2L7M2_9LACO|nr:helix-hairpin-helix domain-containing protein [Furfurilactobacillus siliginis]KRN94861.1 DNA uptake protein related DNA-binding protein [Furfurilactobacillus siliginis]GEK28432.1 competence protein CelA [Furfurilactobacillus siliginis]